MKKLEIGYSISGTKITIPFKANCVITDMDFQGNIIIEYRPRKEVLEYVDLEKFIGSSTEKKLTVEELANIIFIEIEKEIKPEYLKVLVDVLKSDAHQPVQVWIERELD